MRRLTTMMAVLLLLGVTLSGVLAREPDQAAFDAVWQRFDGAVASGQTQRTWFWGPAPRTTTYEPYVEAPGGKRLVQYWDKGRMEITNPNDDPSNPWYVTSGLLVREMISGKMQVGDNEFERRSPLDIPIAGDPYDNPEAPTYASFKRVASIDNPSPGEVPFPFPYGPGINEDNAVLPRIGKFVAETIDRQGNVDQDPSLATAYAGTRIVHYELDAGHNIPDVFWRFLKDQGLVHDDGGSSNPLDNWIYLTGYPITEPYWVKTRIAGAERWVLVQAFERRVLTYNPFNPPGWQVELGNTGLHYEMWRNSPPPPPVVLPPNVNAIVDPSSGPAGTEFYVTLYGFEPGEEIDIWLTLPDQSVIAAPEPAVADENGIALFFGDPVIVISTWPDDPPGIWNLVGQGRRSGNVSIAYFEVTD